jgi:hypothetical protein
MKIEYVNGRQIPYIVVKYSVTVSCEDDGVHFPYFTYNGFAYFKDDEANKTEQEIYDAVVEHALAHYKEHNFVTIEEQMEDPAFKGIEISVEKTMFYNKVIKIER